MNRLAKVMYGVCGWVGEICTYACACMEAYMCKFVCVNVHAFVLTCMYVCVQLQPHKREQQWSVGGEQASSDQGSLTSSMERDSLSVHCSSPLSASDGECLPFSAHGGAPVV